MVNTLHYEEEKTMLASEIESERQILRERIAKLSRRDGRKASLSGLDIACKGDASDGYAEEAFKHEVGDTVESRWMKGVIYYRSTVAAISRDGTRFTVAYRDGSVERDVPNAMTRRVEEVSSMRSRDESSSLPGKAPHVELKTCGRGNEEALLEAVKNEYVEAASLPARRTLPGARFAAADEAFNAARQASVIASKSAARAEICSMYAAKCPGKVSDVDRVVHSAGGSEHDVVAPIRCEHLIASNSRLVFGSRATVVREIARSEDEFALKLRTLEERISVPLRRREWTTSNRHFADDVLKLVAECDGIARLSEKLRADFAAETRRSFEDARIGAAFRRFGPFLKMFAAYARRFHQTSEARRFMAQFFDVDISFDLFAPIERIRDYEELLGELIRLTDEDHPDATDSKVAVGVVREALSHVDKTLDGDVAFERLVQILEPSSLSSLLDVPTRRLLKEGLLDQIKFGPRARVLARPLRCLALSDRILFVAMPTRRDKPRRRGLFTKNSSDLRNAAKGKLVFNFPVGNVSALEPCKKSVCLESIPPNVDNSNASPIEGARANVVDESDTGNDDLPPPESSALDNDDDDLFLLKTYCGSVMVLRAKSKQARDAWIAIINDLRNNIDRLPRFLLLA